MDAVAAELNGCGFDTSALMRLGSTPQQDADYIAEFGGTYFAIGFLPPYPTERAWMNFYGVP
jgi:hypothetical protein